MTLAAADRKSASTGCKAAKIAGLSSYFRRFSEFWRFRRLQAIENTGHTRDGKVIAC